MAHTVADHLAHTYGGRSWEVCELSKATDLSWPRFGIPLAPNYPYIDAEVEYACREYACTVEDVLSRRTRLAFLNKDAALAALPRVTDIMAKELGWTDEIKGEQMFAAQEYVETYGGRISNKAGSNLRNATYRDVIDVFNAIDVDGSGFIDKAEVGEVAAILGFPISDKEVGTAFDDMDIDRNGRVSLKEFEAWWNHAKDSDLHASLCVELNVGGKSAQELREIGPGTMLG